ncbi:MAG: AAA family ATPase [Bacteroidales bacterium]|nr:AAA family ATPase [Bacteroidales bacterium]
MNKFMPSSTTAAILLGNAANQFLDDSINAEESEDSERIYRQSLRKTFLSDPLRFATVNGIGQDFSQQCRRQFQNIWSTVREHAPEQVTLESAFLCESLGIQGRMDLMTTDHRVIWELKSGKADYAGHYRYEHAMQMALYKESLYYNEDLPYAKVSTYLFYSRYPHLMDIHLGRNDIHRAVMVRNGIVHLEHLLNNDPERLLDVLTEQHFNTAGISDSTYEQFQRPQILKFINGLHAAQPLARKYFHRMLTFVEREQFLAKTGVEGVNLPAGHHGFADTWRASNKVKMDAGRLVPNLRLTPIYAGQDSYGEVSSDSSNALLIALDATTSSIDESSNFRVGDMVMLYRQNSETAVATGISCSPASSYISCIIERITADSLRLRLRYPQYDTSFLGSPSAQNPSPHATAASAVGSEDNATNVIIPPTLFSIEPAHADTSYSILYRGLYAFLHLNSERQQLLLGQRVASVDESKTLTLDIPDQPLRDIVLRAKQARDYFLLVGPPGTGKTSVALRLMVKEFLASRVPKLSESSSAEASHPSLLLLAFTNRAVDEICSMLNGIEAPYLRLGPELSCAAEHRNRLISFHAAQHPTRAAIRQQLLSTPIIAGTIASVSALPELFQLKHFCAAIVDEASQALEPHLLPLFCALDQYQQPAIDKFILIGDHKQLPAVVVQTGQDSVVTDEALRSIGLTDCRRSLFERLHETALRQGRPEVIGLLHRQGRMHEDIADFVNRHYYDNQLALVPLPHQRGPLKNQWLGSQRLMAFDIQALPEDCTAKGNRAEARQVAQLVASFVLGEHSEGKQIDWAHRLGIIVPFRGQITLIRRALAEQLVPDYERITIDTVERYQGSQRDIILFSTVVSAHWQMPILSQPVRVNGQQLDRKLNVAITRAREQFILIGNQTFLRQSQPYRQLLDEIVLQSKRSTVQGA